MHIREHQSLTASAEKRLLVWMARRLPGWINSDHLSLLGLACMILTGAGFALMRLTPSAALLVVAALAGNWFGDSLDGTVARVRNQQRPNYGMYVDHVIDIIGATFLFGGLSISGLIAPAIAAALLVAYLLVCAEVYLSTCVSSVFRLSFLKFGPTELRIVLAVGALKVMSGPWVTVAGLGRVRLFDIGGVIAVTGLLLAFVVATVRQTRALYRAEPLPPPPVAHVFRPASPPAAVQGFSPASAAAVAHVFTRAPAPLAAPVSKSAAWRAFVSSWLRSS